MSRQVYEERSQSICNGITQLAAVIASCESDLPTTLSLPAAVLVSPHLSDRTITDHDTLDGLHDGLCICYANAALE